MKKLLFLVLGLFALLGVNSVYLVSVTILESLTGETYQNYFYQYMFLAHLLLGVALILPVLVFGVLHIKNAHDRPNRRAVRVGYALFLVSLVLLGTGVLLTRMEGLIEIKSPHLRGAAYWAHVLSPLVVAWLFVLHRLAGPRINWKVGLRWGAVAGGFALLMLSFHSQDPRRWNVVGPASGEKYFFPSLARTATGNFIPARAMMMDEYCLKCHADIHESWTHSAHRFSSFNNPAYLFSVRNTRKLILERDGDVQASRFCAGCHDPVPFFSGAFDDPQFDDENHSTAHAGITCTACHAITHLNTNDGATVRGNADYTIEEPAHYPFAFSDDPFLQWVNEQLVKAKPAFHKKTFLKPLHRTPEFCGTCHKVHLPEELNKYKFLRGQNHYDSYLLSGVSGHGAQSFYYPKKAVHNCNECHMPLEESDDFGAGFFDDSGQLKIHDHQFPSANTAIPHLMKRPASAIEAHRKFNDGVMRVDIFGIKEGGAIDGSLTAPLEPGTVPRLEPGKTYLLETVIRTLKMGHLFTQGTADSNEVWLDVTVTSGERVLGSSGGRAADGGVDPWSHFVNAYVLDANGDRIDRRNAEAIFVTLYNHQIPPGAADTVHYRFRVPDDADTPIRVAVSLRYRKFDTTYMQHIYGPDFVNDLPILTLASDSMTFPVSGGKDVAASTGSDDGGASGAPVAVWERWNDYGIGLLRKGSQGSQKGELRQAEAAFREVERLGRPDGPLNLARVYFKEGRLDDAVAALDRAGRFDPPAPPWTVAWFTGLVNKQNGRLEEARSSFLDIVETRWQDAVDREFDFRLDYRVLNELGKVHFELAKLERGESRRQARQRLLEEARRWFEEALEIDVENVTAHHNLYLIHAQLGNDEEARHHQQKHAEYKPDDNACDAKNVHRRKNPAANQAAESIVIYDLHRPGAPDLETQ